MKNNWEMVSLSVGDTILGLIKGRNGHLNNDETKSLLNDFYLTNGHRTFKIGQKVKIPIIPLLQLNKTNETNKTEHQSIVFDIRRKEVSTDTVYPHQVSIGRLRVD